MKKYLFVFKHRACNAKGFTVVELLVYMGIFSILLFIFVQLFGSILDAHIDSEAITSIAEDGSFILARMTKDIHTSTSATVTGGNLQLTGGTSSYTYSVDGNGNLMLTDSIGLDQLNSVNTKVSQVTFTVLRTGMLNNYSVQIILKLSSQAVRRTGQPQTETFQTAVEVR